MSLQLPAVEAGYAFDLGRETLVRIVDSASIFARYTGKRPHINQVGRWLRIGARNVVLPSVLIGGRRFTSEPAIRWWIAATSGSSSSSRSGNPRTSEPTPAQIATLERAGILDRKGA